MERFLEKNAVIVMADHAQTTVKRGVRLADALARSGGSCSPAIPTLVPRSSRFRRAAARRWSTCSVTRRNAEREIGQVLERVKVVEGIDLVAWKENGEACLWSSRGELRFAPGSQVTDRRGAVVGPRRAHSPRSRPVERRRAA